MTDTQIGLQEVRRKGEASVDEVVSGQGGTPVAVNESRFTPDEVILDPNSPLAVQIPEGSDADRSRSSMGLADALREGHVEAKFNTAAAPLPVSSSANSDSNEHTRSVGDKSGDEHTVKPVSEYVETPEVHNKPALARAAEEGEVAKDYEAESPASSKKSGRRKAADDDKS